MASGATSGTCNWLASYIKSRTLYTRTLAKETNMELRKIHDWFKTYKLVANPEKPSFCIFMPSHKPLNTKAFVLKMGEPLKQADDIKYLGINIDTKLLWQKHVDKIKNEIVKYASMFAKLGDYIPIDCLKHYLILLCIQK